MDSLPVKQGCLTSASSSCCSCSDSLFSSLWSLLWFSDSEWRGMVVVVVVSEMGCSVEAMGMAVGESEKGPFLWWK